MTLQLATKCLCCSGSFVKLSFFRCVRAWSCHIVRLSQCCQISLEEWPHISYNLNIIMMRRHGIRRICCDCPSWQMILLQHIAEATTHCRAGPKSNLEFNGPRRLGERTGGRVCYLPWMINWGAGETWQWPKKSESICEWNRQRKSECGLSSTFSHGLDIVSAFRRQAGSESLPGSGFIAQLVLAKAAWPNIASCAASLRSWSLCCHSRINTRIEYAFCLLLLLPMVMTFLVYLRFPA